MPFGISPLELLMLLLVFAVPVGVIALATRWVLSRGGSDSRLLEAQNRQLAADLQASQVRLEELEAKLVRSEERAEFTQSLLASRTPPSEPLA